MLSFIVKIRYLLLVAFLLLTNSACGQPSKNDVKIVGEMKNAMWKGQLHGTIGLDTISTKEHLYGLGPVEYLAGEILILDGKSFKSTVVNDSTMKVEETFHIKAPFFGYANIPNWSEHRLPDSVQSIQQLEDYLERITISSPRPFMFKLKGMVVEATIHVVNLPKGSKVSSPDDAHKGQTNYKLLNTSSEILGFFSIEHQAIFTHHDSFLHMHLITSDRQQMGHLDAAVFKQGSMTLFLPYE